MTPKEKAREMVEKFRELPQVDGALDNSKQCALIAVEVYIDDTVKSEKYLDSISEYYGGTPSTYWLEVKQEIQNL